MDDASSTVKELISVFQAILGIFPGVLDVTLNRMAAVCSEKSDTCGSTLSVIFWCFFVYILLWVFWFKKNV